MGEGTGIEWADHTFNPWVGCSKVSPGCAHCYAETLVTGRMARPGTWGEDGVRERTAPSTWKQPLRYERDAERFFEEHGRRQRVFCASLADVFEPRPELAPWRAELFELISNTPSLDWLVLTKRPDVARDWLRDWNFRQWASVGEGPLPPNLWLGTSIENARHTYRADILREIPAAVRFISAEPLLGSLFETGPNQMREHAEDCPARSGSVCRCRKTPLDLTGIDWVIVGGESGPGARPMHPDWAREIRDACVASPYGSSEASKPAFLFKQWGGRTAKAGGRVLDGREWLEFPAPQAVLA